jgi:hypothetical protein
MLLALHFTKFHGCRHGDMLQTGDPGVGFLVNLQPRSCHLCGVRHYRETATRGSNGCSPPAVF